MHIVREACCRKVSGLMLCTGGLDKEQQERFAQELRTKKKSKVGGLLKQKNERGSRGTKVGRAYTFTKLNVRPDGNCFCRCLSMFFEDHEENHESYRNRIVNHIADNRNDYSCYIDGEFDEHVIRQRKTTGEVSSWATEAEILAAAQEYNAEINVYAGGLDGKPARFVALKGRDGYKHHICLQLRNEHFTLLQVADGSTTDNEVQQTENLHPRNNGNEEIDWFEKGYRVKTKGAAVSVEEQIECGHNDNDILEASQESQYVKPSKTKDKSTLDERVIIVTNKSSRKLTRSEEQLLSKGFSFVPTRRKTDIVRLLSDLAEWERRMRLKEFFYDKDEKDRKWEELEKLPWEKKKSDFTPQAGRDKWLDMYIEVVKDDILKGIKTRTAMNVTQSEGKAMKGLMEDTSIVIRSADKGSGIVIVNTEEYIKELKLEVEGNSLYEKCEVDKTKEAERNVKRVVGRQYKQGAICKDLRTYMTPKHPKAGRLKGNSKLHKKNAPYRAIVSGIGTATENMAEVAEKELNEFVIDTPSYVRDTKHFLSKLKEVKHPLEKRSIFFCFDVVKLYPSIPKEKGLRSCLEALEARKEKRIPTEGTMEMVETVLNNNNFAFDGNQYLRKDGVAIGSRLGKNYACTYMRSWDEELAKHRNQPTFYKRFIDDGFGIWNHGENALEEFHAYANSIDKNIKVEMRWDGITSRSNSWTPLS